MTTEHGENERRQFLRQLASGAVLVLAGCAPSGRGRTEEMPTENEEEGISPAEDLMREHGVLERILLIYEECARSIESPSSAPLEVLGKGAGIIRRFVEDYHEHLEEQFVFPRFEAAQRELELVRTLRDQHASGRDLTDQISRLASGKIASPVDRQALVQALRAFSRMYRPHAAREDTVLFPALVGIVGDPAYFELGEQFEEREHALFGEHGFDDVVREVAGLEQILGIHDLAQFTPA